MIADSRTTKPIDIISNDHHALTSTRMAASWAKMRYPSQPSMAVINSLGRQRHHTSPVVVTSWFR